MNYLTYYFKCNQAIKIAYINLKIKHIQDYLVTFMLIENLHKLLFNSFCKLFVEIDTDYNQGN